MAIAPPWHRPISGKRESLSASTTAFEVGHQRVEGNVSGIPIGEAGAPRVVANEHPSIGQSLRPVSPDGIDPVKFEVRKPIVDAHEGRALAGGREGDPHAVPCGAEAYLLFHPAVAVHAGPVPLSSSTRNSLTANAHPGQGQYGASESHCRAVARHAGNAGSPERRDIRRPDAMGVSVVNSRGQLGVRREPLHTKPGCVYRGTPALEQSRLDSVEYVKHFFSVGSVPSVLRLLAAVQATSLFGWPLLISCGYTFRVISANGSSPT